MMAHIARIMPVGEYPEKMYLVPIVHLTQKLNTILKVIIRIIINSSLLCCMRIISILSETLCQCNRFQHAFQTVTSPVGGQQSVFVLKGFLGGEVFAEATDI